MIKHEKIPIADVLAVLAISRTISPEADPNRVTQVVLGPKANFYDSAAFNATQEVLRAQFPELAKMADKISFTLSTLPKSSFPGDDASLQAKHFSERFVREAKAQFGKELKVTLHEPRPLSRMFQAVGEWFTGKPAHSAAPAEMQQAAESRSPGQPPRQVVSAQRPGSGR